MFDFFPELAWDCELLFFIDFYSLHYTSPSRDGPRTRGPKASSGCMRLAATFFDFVNGKRLKSLEISFIGHHLKKQVIELGISVCFNFISVTQS